MEERSCVNCKYFIRHYILCNIRLSKMEMGHCRESLKIIDMPSRIRECKYFCANEIDEKEDDMRIEELIHRIEKNLRYLTLYLKNK